MLFTLIKNEIIKLMNRKKTLVVIIAFILLVGFIGFVTYKEATNMQKAQKPENRIKVQQENIKYTEQDKKNASNELKNCKNEVRKKELINELKDYDNEIKEYNNRIQEIKEEVKKGKPNWKVTLQNRIKESESMLKDTSRNESEKNYINKDLQKYKYLLQNNIEPQEENYDIRATDFIQGLFKLLGMIFLLFGIIIFASDMVSGEYTPPTMKFLLTEPVSRGKILFAKFISVLISSIVLIVGIEIMAFVVFGLIFKFGDMSYPVQVGTKYVKDLLLSQQNGRTVFKIVAGSTYIIPMWKYIVNMFLFQTAFIVAAVSFTFLLSTIMKSSMISMALSIVLAIVFNIFTLMGFLRRYAHYLFSTFGDPSDILTGEIINRYSNMNMTPGIVIGVLVIWTIICYIISHIVFTKKDILI